jgi:hypothetical protein
MERIENINLNGKTPEEAIPIIEKWMNETAKKANYALTHIDRDNFIESYKPVTEKEVQKGMDSLWERVKKLVALNKGE